MKLVFFLGAFLAFASVRAEIPITIPEQNRSAIAKFSHRHHLMDLGLYCPDCHVRVSNSARSADNLLPREADCSGCHRKEVKDPDQCVKCHQDPDNPSPFENPERVIDFPHDYHLAQVGMKCQDCHRGMHQTDYASRVNWPAMPECLSCHQDADAPADCDTCHPRVEVIRPQTHQQDWIHEHRRFSRPADMPCAQCHQDSWCEDCHAGAHLIETTSPTDHAASGAPASRGRIDQVLQRQHELNYRYTHPLDVTGKERECQTCHTPDFCVECHRAEGDERRLKPAWHRPMPNDPVPWVLAGVGSGGGRHARRARRDIEACVACHDVEAGDPSCVQCHVDFDGVRGTDPSTHPSRFADRTGEGEFHGDPNALCFACHVDTRVSGVGFCGYCHP